VVEVSGSKGRERTAGSQAGGQAPDISDSFVNEMQGPQEISELDIRVNSSGKAKITKMVKGKLGDFIPAAKLRNPDYAGRDAVQVYFMTEDGRTFRETFTLSTAANSKLRRFITKYGTPKVGLEVEYREDSRGFPRISL
jgi:hypothetical protein